MRFKGIPWRGVGPIFAALILVAIVSAQEATTGDGDARDHLATLSTTEKEELLRKREQFQQLDDAEKKRLRELHTTIATSPDRVRLEETMLQYHEWLKSLPGKERAELLKLPPSEKIAEIKRLMQEQRSQEFRKLVATPPEPQDVRAIFAWFDGYVEAHESELLATLPETAQGRVKQVTSDSMRRKLLVMALHQNNAEPKLPTPTPDDLHKLDERLSSQAKETLAKVTDPEEKLKLVQGWIRAAVMSRMLPPQVSEERLMAFFRENRERLSKDDPQRIEQLESLPRDEFYQEVRNIYFRERGPWRGHRRDGDDHRNELRGGRDGNRGDGEGRGRDDHRPDDHGRNERGPDGGPRRQRPDGRSSDRSPPEPREGLPPPPPSDDSGPTSSVDFPPPPDETP